MPKKKTKVVDEEVKEKDLETKEIILDDEEKVLDPDVAVPEIIEEDLEDDEMSEMDDDELDPFKDKWEE